MKIKHCKIEHIPSQTRKEITEGSWKTGHKLYLVKVVNPGASKKEYAILGVNILELFFNICTLGFYRRNFLKKNFPNAASIQITNSPKEFSAAKIIQPKRAVLDQEPEDTIPKITKEDTFSESEIEELKGPKEDEPEEVEDSMSLSPAEKKDDKAIERTFGNAKILIKEGDVTNEKVDAIVNAASVTLRAGDGVDGAIHKKAGREIQAALAEVRKQDVFTKRERNLWGHVFVTTAGKMRPDVQYIIHAIPPNGALLNKEELLIQCYQQSLVEANKLGLKSIAFCVLAGGLFGYSVEESAPVALKTIKDYCEENPDSSVKDIRFIMYRPAEWRAFENANQQI